MLEWELDLSVFDLILTPKNIFNHPEYKYFTYGLFAKIVGAIGLGLVYYFYYGGGDTTNYFQSARAYVNLFSKNQFDFIEGWFGTSNGDQYFFDENIGYSVYYHRDSNSFFVVRLLIPIVALAFNSYFASAVLTACVTFTGLWKLYQTFLKEFPALKRELAIAIL